MCPSRPERGNATLNRLYFVGYVTSMPHPSTPTIGPPASTAPSCAAASTPSASPLTTQTPARRARAPEPWPSRCPSPRLFATRRSPRRPSRGPRRTQRPRAVGRVCSSTARVIVVDRREGLYPFRRQAVLHPARVEGPLQLLESARSPLGDLRPPANSTTGVRRTASGSRLPRCATRLLLP